MADLGVQGRIAALEPTGPETYCQVTSDLGDFIIRVPGLYRRSPGEAVHLDWDASSAHVFAGEDGKRV